MGRWKIVSRDVLDALESGELGTFHGVLSDPPYGINFMSSRWDHGVPSSDVWAAVRDSLVPGASVLAFGGPRTVHRLTTAIEDAGFEIRDNILCWMFGTGWPKPGDVSKFIDRRLGAEPVEIGPNPNARPSRADSAGPSTGTQTTGAPITAPATDDAARFAGYHANLKPAHEPVVVARKPLDGSLADNALTHGVAGLNVDGCRISTGPRPLIIGNSLDSTNVYGHGSTDAGRWPTNTTLVCDEEWCGAEDPRLGEHHPGCPVAVLDTQSGPSRSSARPRANKKGGFAPGSDGSGSHRTTGGFDDAGTASRFFYIAKASRRERDGIPHPCMKPIALCRWLATLILPPPRADGAPRRILVPFSGSGSEMIGALEAGWDEVVGIEFDSTAENPAWWAEAAAERIGRWERRHAADVALAVEMGARGYLDGTDFRARGVKPQDWIAQGWAKRDGKRLIPGPNPMPGANHDPAEIDRLITSLERLEHVEPGEAEAPVLAQGDVPDSDH